MTFDLANTKALVVENQNEVRNMREILNEIGFGGISDITSGLKALTEIKKILPDIILVNFYLPQYSGMQLFKSLKDDKTLSTIKFIMITPKMKSQELDEIKKQGVKNIICRPFEISELRQMILDVFDVDPEEMKSLADVAEKNGMDLFEKGDYKGALVAFRKAREANPNASNAKCFVMAGKCYMELEEFGQAAASFKNAHGIDAHYPKINHLLGMAHQKRENFLASVKSLEEAVDDKDASAETHVDLGKSYLGANMDQQAEKAFDKAITMDPKNMENRTDIGNAYLDKGMYVKAETTFGAALDINPSNIPLYNRMAIALRKQGKYQEAINIYSKAIKVAPKDEGLYYNLARALCESGEKKKALKALDIAISIDPEFEEAISMKNEYQNMEG